MSGQTIAILELRRKQGVATPRDINKLERLLRSSKPESGVLLCETPKTKQEKKIEPIKVEVAKPRATLAYVYFKDKYGKTIARSLRTTEETKTNETRLP